MNSFKKLTQSMPKPGIDNLKVHGPVDYYKQMPYIFKLSDINLNISLKSIRTGIPLRW